MDFKLFFCTAFIFIITITGVASVTLIPSAKVLAVGANVTLTINPVPVSIAGSWQFGTHSIVLWYPNGFFTNEVYQDRISFNRLTLQLTLFSMQLNDSGLYLVQGQNVQAETTLSVQEPIQSVSLTASNTHLVEFNDSVTFNCSTYGTSLTFSWHNGSSEVTTGGSVELSDNGSVLTITNVTRYDTGPFICTVANAVSNGTSGSVYPNISYGPSNLSIAVLPMQLIYISGSDITLLCAADSSPPASFQWSYNNITLNEYGQVFHLTNATRNQTGAYACTAFNPVTLRYATVTSTIFIMDPISAAVVVGDAFPIFNMSTSLSCEITGPVDSVYWMQDGLHLYPDGRIFLSNQNKTLTLNQLTLSDDRNYQCVAFNAVSNKTSNPYSLIINYGPWNVTISGPAVAEVGSIVKLFCDASSRPSSNYTWYFYGSKVAEGSIYETGSLSLNNSGEYTCTAHNNITGDSSTATFNLTVVVGISSVEVNPSTLIPLDSKDLTLFCNITGMYDSLYWIKDNLTFNGTSTVSVVNATIAFRPLHITDDGEYKCVATNFFGAHYSNPYQLTAIYGPVDITITAKTVFKTVLTCEAKSQPPSVYRWIFNGNTNVGEGNTVTVSMSASQGSNYTCVAQNPLTNVTISSFYIVPDAATAVKPTTVFLAVALSALSLLL